MVARGAGRHAAQSSRIGEDRLPAVNSGAAYPSATASCYRAAAHCTSSPRHRREWVCIFLTFLAIVRCPPQASPPPVRRNHTKKGGPEAAPLLC